MNNIATSKDESFLLTIVNVSIRTWSATVDMRRQLIGRGQTADIRLPQQYLHVSRRHAEIWMEKGQVRLCDVGSSVGTKVNGVWLKPHSSVRVAVNDKLWLGGLELVLTDHVSHHPEFIDNPVDSEQDSRIFSTAQLPSRVLLDSLTPSERDVLLCMCRGEFDDEEIGRQLCRSSHTVRTQVGSIMRKLGIHSRANVIGFLRENSLFP